jgi:GT2 family glycosyltransferase
MSSNVSYDRVKVVAVVSTYNRPHELRRCLLSLLSQDSTSLKTIIVIDGSETDETEQMIRKEFPQVKYVRIRENIGGAGQFYIGLKLACRKGCDWVWVMDDDVEIIRKDGLKILLDKAYELKNRGIPVGAVIPLQLANGHVAKVGPLSIFVGGLISKEAIMKVGFPRYDFFIYYDDVEYVYRIIRAGFSIKYAPPILEHKGWVQRPSFCIRILKRRYCLPILTRKRMYYLTRNGIIFSKQYGLPILLLRIIIGSLIRALAYAFILRDLLMPVYVIRGIIEGFLCVTKTRV